VFNWDVIQETSLIMVVPLSALSFSLASRLHQLKGALKHNRQQLQECALLGNSLPLGLAVHQAVRDENGAIVDYRLSDLNSVFEHIFNQPRSHYLSKSLKEVFPKSADQWMHILDRVRVSGEVRRSELYFIEHGRWCQIDSYQQAPDRIVTLLQDITQHKRDHLLCMESDERLRLCQRQAQIGVWQLNLRKYRFLRSPFLRQLLGRPTDKRLTWQDFLDSVHSADREQLVNAVQHNARRHGHLDIDFRITNDAGQQRWLHAKAEVECNQRGKPRKMQGTVQDVTERYWRQAPQQLHARAFSDTQVACIMTDKDTLIVDVNQAFCDLSGFEREEVLGKNPRFLNSGRQNRSFYADMWRLLHEQGHWQGELWNKRKNGELFAALLSMSVIRDERGEIVNYIGSCLDITETQQHRQRLEHLVYYDALTGLPNRTLFADRFKQAVAHSNRYETLLAVCYLDLDGFKYVNDNFGHAVGDDLLIEVGKRIQLNLRAGDTVCRLGGDEFALLFENLQSLPQCEDTLSRIHDALAEPFILGGQQIRIAASSGVTVYPLDMEESDVLLRHADQAMYLAKLAGRNRYRIYDKLCDLPYIVPHQVHEHLDAPLLDIQHGLENQQFCIHYQPKVNLKSGKVVGAEALLRWQHPERGLLLPSEFLPMVNGSPLEMELNTWVIRQVFQQILEWQNTELHLQVSVNVSANYILWPSFLSTLEEILDAYPTLDSKLFELEVMENSASHNVFLVAEILKQCGNRFGINYSLDDFGKSSPSLQQLRNFFVNSVKIDQSFVTEMLDNPDDQSMVESVIGLAKAFRRNVVAEGVESVEHGVLLLNLGCELAQGYAIAHPMPGADLPNWVGNYRNHPAWSNSAKTQLSNWQTQLVILKIQQLHWLKRIRANLHTTSTNRNLWPELNPNKSYLGRWLTRCRNEGLLASELLTEFKQTHEVQCRQAQQLLDDCLHNQKAAIAGHYADLVKTSRLIDHNLQACMSVEQE
jgi:diguanylate cyclase (GGDEF)-like protein/PAS domain S-box-containing protein